MTEPTAPWLTVITVVKDDPEGMQRTLESLRRQDLDGVEYLVIDSSFDQGAVSRLLVECQVAGHVVWSEPAGIYSAMNGGLELASGTYVHFLNAGDEFATPDVLTKLRTVVSANRPVWLHGPVEIVGVDGRVTVTPSWDYAAEEATAFSRGRFPAHQGTIARAEALRSVGGFDPSYRIAADYAAFLQLTTLGSAVVLPFVVARFHEGGVSTRAWAASIREFHRARRQILAPSGAARQREQVETVRQFTTMAAHRSPWPLGTALALLMFGLMGATGVAWNSAAILTLIVVLQGLGGALWWRMLRPSRSVPVLEAVGMGLGLGLAGAMLTGLADAWWLAFVIAVIAWLSVGRRATAPMAPLARGDLLALAIGLGPGLVAFALAVRSYPLTWVGVWNGYHGDMPFFEALAASVARLGPGASIFMDGAELRYHSLAYGWAGELTAAAGAEPFVVLTRTLPIVTLIAVVAITAAWTRSFTRTIWAPALAVALVVTGGFVGATYGSVLNFDSPSQSMGAVWLLALSVVLMQSLNRVSLPWHALAVAALTVALTGGKVSTAAIAAGGFGLVVVVGLIRREPWRWRALAMGIIGLAALLATYAWLLAGSANAGGLALFTLLDRASSVQGLNPVVTPKGIIAGIAVLVVAVLPRWAGLAWLLGDRATRWRPESVYGLGLALGGTTTIVMLSGGFNDLWFAVAASAPLAVLSALGVERATDWLGAPALRRVLLAAGVGLAIALFVAWVWTTGSTGIIGDGWRWVGPLFGFALSAASGLVIARGSGRPFVPSAVALTIVALVMAALPARLLYAAAEPFARPQQGSWSTVLFSPTDPFMTTLDWEADRGWSSTKAQAGAWLRAHADPDDLVATNWTLQAYVPALTHLTTYISDIHMQAPYGRQGDVAEIRLREEQSWAFIQDPSSSTLAPLCAAGVRWVWVDLGHTATRDWAPYGTTVWAGEDTMILRIDPSACA